MPRAALALILLLAGCAALDPGAAARRAAVEVAVKSSFPAVLADIEAGGGPALTQAFDAAGVPAADRPARILQLGGDLPLHAANPGALEALLALWGA